MRHLENLILSTAASTILLLLELGPGSAFQQNPDYTSQLSRRHAYLDRPSRYLLSSVAVDVTDYEEVGQSTYDWDEQFEELQSFMSTYGHCNFPQNAPATLTREYPMLAGFCHDQRVDYSIGAKNRRERGSLVKFDLRVRWRRLKELGFEFDMRSARWYDHYHQLAEFYDANGHCMVGINDDFSLYTWGKRQRSKYREGSLSETKIELLNKINCPWEGYSTVSWKEMYEELVSFHRQHGHFRVDRNDNVSLHIWIHNQRLKRTTLSEEQQKLLHEINFPWGSDIYEAAWYERYRELVAFKKEHGHLMVEYDSDLDRWILYQQRRLAGKGFSSPLSDEQKDLLNEIDFPWKPFRFDRKWNEQYNELRQFHEKHGHSQVPFSGHAGLYGWCTQQRKKLSDSLLSTEQIELLDKLDFPREVGGYSWITMYNQLCSFADRHGHLRVDKDDDPDLYEWIMGVRQLYNQTALSNTQIERLEELQFRWPMDGKERTWFDMYAEAVEFFKEHGHVEVTEKENPSLYNWIQTQEKRYNKLQGQKPLSEEELEMLEQIDFAFFDGQPRMAWNKIYAEVARYREENDGQLPTSRKDEPNLSSWLRQQRQRYRCGYGFVPLSDEQKSLLEVVDFPRYPEWKTLRQWYESYDELVNFRNENGHFLVDRKQSPALSRWLLRQRVRYHGTSIHVTRLPKSQVYLMDRIGFPWTSNFDEMEWQKTYNELVEFIETHGRFPKSRSEDPKLFQWIVIQRSKYNRPEETHAYRPLSEDQFQQLDKIGMRWEFNYNRKQKNQ